MNNRSIHEVLVRVRIAQESGPTREAQQYCTKTILEALGPANLADGLDVVEAQIVEYRMLKGVGVTKARAEVAR